MSNLTAGVGPKPYGRDGRKVYLPVKATTQVYQGGLAAQIAGACVPATAAGAGRCIGVYEADALGGASDGSTRVPVWTDKVFIFPVGGSNAPTDATPFGTPVYADDDNHVSLTANETFAGYFMGLEDDGKARVFVGVLAGDTLAINGTALADTATQSAASLGRTTRYAFPTMSQNSTVNLSTTGANAGDVIRIVRTDASAHTLAVVDGGTGTPTLATLVASKTGFVQAYFNGTNWLLDGNSAV
jgi:hypothetical protein